MDGAWGASAAVSDRLRPFLAGIERADSVTWDAHKWLSVPVSAGMFFCRHRAPVESAFGVDAAYVPPRRDALARNNLSTSLQWSRRFMGLKVFMVLAENALLLVLGLAAGIGAAVLSVLPHLALGASIPWARLALLLGLVAAAGVLAGALAVRSTLRAPLLPALRKE